MKYLPVIILVLSLLACSTTHSPPQKTSWEQRSAAETPSAEPIAAAAADQTQSRTGGSAEPDPSPSYRILKEGRHNYENWLQLNEYFLIHHLYTDILHRFGLHKRFSLEDKIRILAGVLYNLDFKSPVNLIIDNFNEGGSLVVSLQLVQIGRHRGILMATNTDPEGKTIYVGLKHVAETYKRPYVIVEDQLIALSDLYSQSKESALIKENSADRLARFYIFDGNISNDTVAEGLLIGSIRAAETPAERCRSELILSRYYMSQNRLVEAQALLLAVGSQLKRTAAGADELREGYSIVYEELLITNALKQHEERLRSGRPESL